jgi:hypothetical protein
MKRFFSSFFIVLAQLIVSPTMGLSYTTISSSFSINGKQYAFVPMVVTQKMIVNE